MTETFSGMDGLFITFDRETGSVLCCGCKNSMQTVLDFSEVVGVLNLPEEAMTAAGEQ